MWLLDARRLFQAVFGNTGIRQNHAAVVSVKGINSIENSRPVV